MALTFQILTNFKLLLPQTENLSFEVLFNECGLFRSLTYLKDII